MKKIIVFSTELFHVCRREKTLFLTLLPLLMLGVSSCTKRQNCECGLTGKFIYYEEPQEIIYCGYPQKINASFTLKDIPVEGPWGYYIVGSIPKQFKTQDTVLVNVCIKKIPRGTCLAYGVPAIYKLTCIEKAN